MLTFFTATALFTANSAPAGATALCWNTGCTGVNPQSSGCSSNGGSTVRWRYWSHNNLPTDDYGLELRRSSGCDAQWARFIRDDCEWLKNNGYYLKLRADLWTPYGWYHHATYYKDVGYSCDTRVYTSMIGQSSARYAACYIRYENGQRPNPAGVPDEQWECLDWYYT
ncbi:hypothetical protein [Acrocarpospora sp. B8E8]|uniref:hypothetical protein n=1 Tax=Acrocarpospora sp. B8E8 TaxID=3153572 RepID=UPI00325FA1ED